MNVGAKLRIIRYTIAVRSKQKFYPSKHFSISPRNFEENSCSDTRDNKTGTIDVFQIEGDVVTH